MKKFLTLVKEYRGTHVLVGSSTLFFFYFWLTKGFSFLQQQGASLNTFIHHVVHYLPQPDFQIKNSTGVFLVRAFDDSTTICSDYFESHLRPWLEHPIQKDIFLDVGANRGLYTVLALTKYDYQKAYAFEPNPEVCTLLEKNIKLNNIVDKTHIEEAGLGSKEAVVGFEVDVMHKGGGRVAEQRTGTLTVSIRPLDAILDDATASRVSFIKIDTEGYESAVLEGAKRTLTLMPVNSCIMVESAEPARIASVLTHYDFVQEASVAYDHLFIKSPPHL